MEPTGGTTEPLRTALEPLLLRLQRLAEQDAELRAELLHLGQTLVAFATAPTATATITQVPTVEPASDGSTGSASAPPTTELASQPDAHKGEPAAAPIVTREADTPPADPVPTTSPPPAQVRAKSPSGRRATGTANRPPSATAKHLRPVYVTPVTGTEQPLLATEPAALEALATACALKADAARWMAQRQQYLALEQPLPTDFAAEKWKLIEHAQTLPECYLWMLHQELPTTTAPALYLELGNCYEACAHLAMLLDKLVAGGEENDAFVIQALGVAAIAQAMLRHAVQGVGGTADHNQHKLYQWLENAHTHYHLQMRRYNRRSKETNPQLAAELVKRVQDLVTTITTQRKRQNSQRRQWRNANKLATAILATPDGITAQDWQPFIEAVTGLVKAGVQPSSVELRTLLLPLLDRLPDTVELSKEFSLVLRAIDHVLQQAPEEPHPEQETTASPDLLRVRALLQGQSVLFIGGDRRLAAEEALRSAFALQELIWVEGRDQTFTAFEPYVARPEVTVVILALRWSPHSFGQVKEYCDRYDKLFVRLLSGYNPNQVANVILDQIGTRLEQRRRG